jgi:hypothetical protein
MDCIGLALIWERTEQLRERIREEKRVLLYSVEEKYCKSNRRNCINNAMVLIPILKRLGPGKPLPKLTDLTREVTTLYEKTGLPVGNKAPYKTSVELKKLAGFIKRRVSRKEVTKDQCH